MEPPRSPNPPPSRRSFFRWVALGVALLASYGTGAAYAARFLFPNRRRRERRVFACYKASLPPGASLKRRAPGGREVLLTNAGGEIVALSNVCPHLGCTVHWEARESRFFCPCHQGVFTPDGIAVSGPPARAGQRLERFPVSVQGEAVFLHLTEEV
ncbi:MAG TPA: Rieske (2Fe-2S) protein [Planctomycetota bacterium]|nr:Rieske (2Fe-2S) protein [Planctomycetota bacterium]